MAQGKLVARKNSQNPDLKELCARYAAMTKRFNQSGLAKHDLRELQKEAGKFATIIQLLYSVGSVLST